MKLNKQLKTILPLAVIAGLGLTGTASAALNAIDFNTGGVNTGFGATGGSGNRFPVASTDLAYANYGITQGGTVDFVYGGNTDHVDRMDSYDTSAAMSGEIWFSILVNVPTGGGFAGISFHSDNIATSLVDYSHNASDLRVMMSETELWVDWNGGATNAAWDPDATVTVFSAGTHLILGQMNVVAGNDMLNVWVDPDVNAAGSAAGLGAADYTNSLVDYTDSIVRVGMPINATGDTTDALYVSDTGTAFTDVTGVVPEPSTTALLGLGGLALILRRRK